MLVIVDVKQLACAAAEELLGVRGPTRPPSSTCAVASIPDALSTLPPKPLQSTVALGFVASHRSQPTYCRCDRIHSSSPLTGAPAQSELQDEQRRALPGIYSPLVDLLRERGWRIEQMPCPEHAFLGLVKDQADTLALATLPAPGEGRRRGDRRARRARHRRGHHRRRGQPLDGRADRLFSAEWGGRPDKGEADYPLVPGRGIFSEDAELAERGLGDVRASGIEHQLPDYDEAAERAQISSLLEQPSGR